MVTGILQKVSSFLSRLTSKKLRKLVKCIVLSYSILYNIALTLFLVIFILSYVHKEKVDKMLMLWSFLPVVILIAIKSIAGLTTNLKSEGGCTAAVCKLILKILTLITIGLGLKKMEDNSVNLSWTGIVIPVWIVTAVLGGCTLIAVLLFITKLGVACKTGKIFTNDVRAATWATVNLLYVFGMGVYLLLKGAAFGDGKATIDVFLPACYTTIAFGSLMIIWMVFGYSSL